MKRFDKIETILLLYILCKVINYAFGNASSVWDSFYFITEHALDIFLLLQMRFLASSVFSNFILYGLVLYKLELIAYNSILAFVPYVEYKTIKCYNNFALLLLITICVSVGVAKFNVEILAILNKAYCKIQYVIIKVKNVYIGITQIFIKVKILFKRIKLWINK